MVSAAAVVVLGAAVLVYRAATPTVDIAALNAQAANEVSAAQSSMSVSRDAARAQARITVFIGDGGTLGRGATDPDSKGWVGLLSVKRGWTVVNFGAVGSGYSAGYQDRIAAIVGAHPARVVVAGGGNDAWVFATHPETAIVAVRQFFDSLHQRLPRVQIVAISPLWNWEPPPAGLIGIATAVKLAVSRVGGKYVDIGQPLARRADWFVADRVHPNDIGYATVAAAIDRALGS